MVIVLVILLLLVAVIWFVKRRITNLTDISPNEKIMTLTDANFSHQLKNKTILVDFWADWCMPCKMMSPILNDLASDIPDGYFIAKLDVDKNQGTAQKYDVRSIPTLILFKDGKEVNRFVGIKNKNFLKKEMMR